MFFLLVIFVFSFLITKLFIPVFYNLLYNSNCVKENFSMKKIPLAMGIIFIPVITLFISLIIIINKKINIVYSITFLIGILGIGIVGLIDDLLGNRNDSGLKGHFKKLFKGQLTTGGFKAVFGFIIGFLISLIISEGLPNIIINSLIIVLFTNLINLLDLRPARALKGFIFLALLLIYPISKVYRLIIWGILGMVIAYLPYDIKSKTMMGDIGSNILGISLGIVSTSVLLSYRIYILIALIIIHIYTEKYSLTSTIEKNKILKYIDELGR